MNRFEGKLCPVCRGRFDDKADIVVCPICGTPHHRSCYEIRGHCGVESFHESGFVWNGRLPDEPEPAAAQPTDEVEVEVGNNNGQNSAFSNNADNPSFSAYSADENAFGSYMRKLGDPTIGEDGVSMKELTAYAATSPFHYGRAFSQFRASFGKKRRVFFNFASGFFAPVFQFYRKMGVFGLIAALITLVPFALSAFFPALFESQSAYYLLNLYNIASLLLLSAFGDYIYYLHAVKSIKKFRGEFQGDTLSDEYFEELSEKGRPSVLRAIIGGLVLMLLMGGILWLSGTGSALSGLL